MVYLIIIALCFAIFAWIDYKKNKSRKTRNMLSIRALENTAKNHLKKIPTLKTTNAKIKSYEKALEALKKAGRYSECREIIIDYDEMLARIKKITKVLPIYDTMDKAHEHRSKEDAAAEKQILLLALNDIKRNNITNEDFRVADVRQDATGAIVQIQDIVFRLKELEGEGV